jgi:hypothetical protein
MLVPAGAAVMLSYLIQIGLSEKLKYRSLYEAQVPQREDSPAHYLSQVRTALTLLRKREVNLAGDVGHVDLLRLLRSRERFDLPGDRELQLAQLTPDSSLAGKSIDELYSRHSIDDLEIIAVLRREHVLLPHLETRLEDHDRLVLITSAASRRSLQQDITNLPYKQQLDPLQN